MPSGGTTVYSVEYTKVQAGRKAAPAKWGDETRMDTYEASALAAGAYIYMFDLHPNEIIKGGRLYWDALGASTQATVGTTDDTDRFMTVAPTAVASLNGPPGLAGAGTGMFNAIDGIGYENTTNAPIPILVAMADVAATGTITLVCHIGRSANS